MTSKPNTPLWQLEQNAQSYRQAEIAHHADSVRSLEKVRAAAASALSYEEAIAVLRGATRGDEPAEGV